MAEALLHFFVVVDAVGGVQLRHLGAGYGGTFLGGEGIAQVGAPLRIAACKFFFHNILSCE